MPRRLHGLIETLSSPAYAAGVGLLLWGARKESMAKGGAQDDGGGKPWYQRILDWLKVLFP
jgi:hypothetical protein